MPLLIEVLFGSEFDSAVGPARILLVAAVVQFTLAWSKMFHAAVGRPHVRTILETSRLAISLGILFWLGDEGAEGAAWAYTVATLVTSAAWLLVVQRYLAGEIARAEAHPRTAEEEEQLEAEQIAQADLERPGSV
jgi:O-antigen/teichoic acid export membrane protein